MRRLTFDEQLQYEALVCAVRKTSHKVHVTNNDKNRAAYDKAIEDIMRFEKEHERKSVYEV